MAAPPRRVPKYVRASLERKRIPLWVMPVLAFLPIWCVIYVNTLSKPYSNVPTQLVDGATVYSNCSSCHGSNGEGGVGRQLNEGEVLKTFPHLADQLEFVWQGDVGTGIGKVLRRPQPTRGPAHRRLLQRQPDAGVERRADPGPAARRGAPRARDARAARRCRPSRSRPTAPLLWPNLTPVLNPTTGLLQNPDGTVMLDPTTGKLTNPAAGRLGRRQRLTASRAGAASMRRR